MLESRRTLAVLAVVGLVLAAVPTWVAATSSTVGSPVSIGYAATGVLMTWGAGLLLWTRPRDRRMATMLFILAGAYSLRGIAASDDPWVYTLTRAVDPAAEALLLWVVLSFPSGHIRARHDRILLMVAGATVTFLWLPVVLFAANIPLRNSLTPCQSDCPRNVMLVADAPHIVEIALAAFQLVAGGVLVAAAVSLGLRLRKASPLTQRTLTVVLIASIARLLVIAIWLASPSATPAWLRLTTFWAIPVAIVIGLLIVRLYTASALQRLVSGLQRRPDAQQLEQVMAEALRDPDLRIVYWLSETGQWSRHGELGASPVKPGPGQTITPLRSQGQTIAAVVHDEALCDQPELLEAVLASARIALETNRLEAALAVSDASLAEAPTQARRALERDLHDGAQQRLIALRMKVSVLSRLFDQDPRRAAQLAEELGPDIDATLTELRDLAHGRAPIRLEERGLEPALADLVARAGPTVHLETTGLRRYPPRVERTVFFICSEALQNCAKHAGAVATVHVLVRDEGTTLHLRISDDGPGCTRDAAGEGMRGMVERAAGAGGQLSVVAEPGVGTVVSGYVPVESTDPVGRAGGSAGSGHGPSGSGQIWPDPAPSSRPGLSARLRPVSGRTAG